MYMNKSKNPKYYMIYYINKCLIDWAVTTGWHFGCDQNSNNGFCTLDSSRCGSHVNIFHIYVAVVGDISCKLSQLCRIFVLGTLENCHDNECFGNEGIGDLREQWSTWLRHSLGIDLNRWPGTIGQAYPIRTERHSSLQWPKHNLPHNMSTTRFILHLT